MIRRARPKLRDVVADTIVTLDVTVDRHKPPPPNRPRAPYQIYASDETGDITLTYFNARRIIWKSCCRSASCATCRARPRL
jgi:ATP-dependent DNA helicase RecG